MFSHLIGNEEVKGRLSRLLANGRLPNALLFAGPEGVGKKLFAIEVARSFVCTNSVEDGACRECSACKRVSIFNTPTSDKGDDYDHVFFSEHADVGLVIPFKRNLRVGAIRALETQANFRPYEAHARVFIVDDADKMNDAAANALLKTLEEPPETTYIILVSSRPDALLATIRSRCQTIRFAPVPAASMQEFLIANASMSETDAQVAARISKGSVGRAIDLNIGQFHTGRDAQLGVIEAALIEKNRPSLIRASERLNDAKNKDRFEDNLDILETLVRDLWLMKNDDAATIINFDLAEKLDRLSAEIPSERLALFLAEIEAVRSALNVNINRKMAADALFMQMSA